MHNSDVLFTNIERPFHCISIIFTLWYKCSIEYRTAQTTS